MHLSLKKLQNELSERDFFDAISNAEKVIACARDKDAPPQADKS